MQIERCCISEKTKPTLFVELLELWTLKAADRLRNEMQIFCCFSCYSKLHNLCRKCAVFCEQGFWNWGSVCNTKKYYTCTNLCCPVKIFFETFLLVKLSKYVICKIVDKRKQRVLSYCKLVFLSFTVNTLW